MEISKEQLTQIDNYLMKCKVKYEDVKKELLDHFASILEIKLKENPKLDFHQELENIHKNFGENGFKDLLDEKKKSKYKADIPVKHFLIDLNYFFLLLF